MRDWLGRGLDDAMLGFIQRAKNSGFGLRAAVYEFTWEDVAKEFNAAAKRGADVHLMIAGQTKGGDKSIRNENTPAAKMLPAKIYNWRDAATINISHNKFILLLKAGKPVAVWTGSTNMTDGGVFGQSNVGHIVEDAGVAAQYLKYWNELAKNPAKSDFSKINDEVPVPEKDTTGIEVIFSPREQKEALLWYAKMVQSAKTAAFITLPFGIGAEMLPALTTSRQFLKFVLMDTKGVPALTKNFEPAAKVPWNRVAVGQLISAGVLEQWNADKLTNLNDHVRFLHTKYMLIDPLGDNPMVITGSANFSAASILNNDENTLVIHKDPRVADIYLTEYMRQFVHYSFADHVMGDASSVKPATGSKKTTTGPGKGKKLYLSPDSSWIKPFKKGTAADAMRKYFSGT